MKLLRELVYESAFRTRVRPQFRIGNPIRGNLLKRGMKVAASYNSTNQGTDYVEILGFTNNKAKYGESGVQFNSVKDIFRSLRGVSSLKGLEEYDDKNEYGYSHYMVVRDLEDGQSGPWYYLYKGRWSRGSGAEALSFREIGFAPVESDETP